MTRCLPALTLTLALLLGACSDSGSISADEFIQSYPKAMCGYIWNCCKGIERSYNSQVSCQLALEGQLRELLGFRNDAKAFATFDGAAAQACLDKLATRSCSDTNLVYGCLDGVTVAQHKKDEECKYSAECSSYYCAQPQKNVRGLCADRSSIGGNCSGDDRGCPNGSYCSSLRKCETKKSAGTSCSRGAECTSEICNVTSKACASKPKTFCTGS